MLFKINIIDDEKNLNDLVRTYLEKEGYSVCSFYMYDEALLHKDDDVHLWLIDIMLDKASGFELFNEIKASKPKMPIIFMSARDQEFDRIIGLEKGSDDYITKPFSLMVLVSKVQAFMRRMEGVCGHNRILSGNIEVNYGEMRALKRNADGVTPLTLSKKELQIMIYFMENARQILSKEQILEYVWDVDGQFVDDNTVPVNISRLKGKIGNDYIQNVRGMGYIWTEESVQE